MQDPHARRAAEYGRRRRAASKELNEVNRKKSTLSHAAKRALAQLRTEYKAKLRALTTLKDRFNDHLLAQKIPSEETIDAAIAKVVAED